LLDLAVFDVSLLPPLAASEFLTNENYFACEARGLPLDSI